MLQVVSLIFIAFQAVAITLTVFTGQRSFQSSNEISAEAADQTSQVSGFSKLVGKNIVHSFMNWYLEQPYVCLLASFSNLEQNIYIEPSSLLKQLPLSSRM